MPGVGVTATGPDGSPPDDQEIVPTLLVEGAALDLVELAVSGVLGISGFPARAELASAVLPISLPVPGAQAEAVRAAGRVVLEDAEGVPVAGVEVDETWPDPGHDDGRVLASGKVTPLRPLTHGAFRRLRLSPEQVRAAFGREPRVVVTASDPMLAADVQLAAALSATEPVLLLALVGSGRRPYPDAVGLVQALRATLTDLPPRSVVVPVPLPQLDDPTRDSTARSALAHAYGGTDVTNLLPEDPAVLDRAVAEGAGLSAPVLEVVRAHRRPLDRRGVVLLFSGLSGSGKSTVARGVEEALLESSGRTLTFLDGDVVRRHLSKGLGFSRADRDTNVRRIGFVAAEVARHGGIAICAPIAPYASTRAAVRAMVEDAGGEFVLVHVATPIEICEARDRKGLYALARAGKIPEFTGVSDPYEEPDDADLRIDTSVQDVGTAVDVVLEELRTRGLVPAARREGH
jgi:sulfate adenylyltransferase